MSKSIGRRKCSIATLQISKNISNKILVNGIDYRDYFHENPFHLASIIKPFEILGIADKPSLSIAVSGGGLSGQAEACRLAIARVLQSQKSSYRQLLKSKLMLRQDARQKERRKYGLKKARKAPQFSKR